MKSFQYLTTVVALTLLASHHAVAAPTSGNQVRSDSQSNIYPEAFPIPSGENAAVSNTGSVGNQIGIVAGDLPPNAVALSGSGKHTDPDGGTVEWTSGPNSMNVEYISPTGGTLIQSHIESEGNQIGEGVDNISPTAVNIVSA